MADTRQNFNVRDIISNVLAELKMNAPTFANSIGVDYMRVYNIQRGRTKKISPEMADLICSKYPQINRMYLYDGCGSVVNDKYDTKPTSSNLTAIINSITEMYSRIEHLYNKIDDRYNKLIEKEHELSQRELALVKRETTTKA